MAQRWQDVEHFMVEAAGSDLVRWGEVRPLLVAFTGEHQCFLAILRWFAKGEYADPMIELLSLAMACDVDRLAFGVAGRLTSLDDPIVPVTAGADLRQRALVVEYADATGEGVERRTLVHPFDHAGDAVTWGATVHLSQGKGWIPEVIGLSVEHRGELARAADHGVRAQADRCAALGHELFVGPKLHARLTAGGLPCLRDRVRGSPDARGPRR